ncbi:MAG: hypothetical protein ACKO14_05080 [Armatimonadota bacterium]
MKVIMFSSLALFVVICSGCQRSEPTPQASAAAAKRYEEKATDNAARGFGRRAKNTGSYQNK